MVKKEESIAEELQKRGVYIVHNNRLQHFNVTDVIEEDNRFLIICGDQLSTYLYKEGVPPSTFGELGRGDIIYRMEFSATKPATYSEVAVKGVYEAESEYTNDLIEVFIDDPKEPKSYFEKSFKISPDASSTRLMGVSGEGVVSYVVSKEKGEEEYAKYKSMIDQVR